MHAARNGPFRSMPANRESVSNHLNQLVQKEGGSNNTISLIAKQKQVSIRYSIESRGIEVRSFTRSIKLAFTGVWIWLRCAKCKRYPFR